MLQCRKSWTCKAIQATSDIAAQHVKRFTHLLHCAFLSKLAKEPCTLKPDGCMALRTVRVELGRQRRAEVIGRILE